MCSPQDQLKQQREQRPLSREHDPHFHASTAISSRSAQSARRKNIYRAGYTGAMRRSPKSLQPVVSWYSDFLEERCAEHERLAALEGDADQGFSRPMFNPMPRAPVPAPSPSFPIPYHKVGPLQPIPPKKKRTLEGHWSNQHGESYWSTWQAHPGLVAPTRLVDQKPTPAAAI